MYVYASRKDSHVVIVTLDFNIESKIVFKKIAELVNLRIFIVNQLLVN